MSKLDVDEKIREYWQWVAGLLFILITVDMLTTIFAASVYGVAPEANPVVGWLLQRGLVELVLANLLATALVVVLFYGLMVLIQESEPPHDRVLSLYVEVCIGVLCAVGLAVFANNLSVIILGQSLF